MIRLVCFDIDDTLMDFHKGEEVAFYEAMEENGEACDDLIYREYARINDGLWKALERKEVTKGELRSLRFSLLKEKLNLHYDVVKMSESFVKHLACQCFLIEGSVDVLEKCALDYPLAVATNGIASVQRGRLERSHLLPFFKYLFISEEMGCDKPHLKYFEEIFETANVKADEVLFVGDSLSADMKGSSLAGCVSVWYNPKHLENHSGVKVDYEICDLSEVLDILEDLK